MVYLAGLAFLIAGFGMWLLFKYKLIVLNQLGRGLGLNQHFKGENQEKVWICSNCSKEIKTKNDFAYCDHCQKYI